MTSEAAFAAARGVCAVPAIHTSHDFGDICMLTVLASPCNYVTSLIVLILVSQQAISAEL